MATRFSLTPNLNPTERQAILNWLRASLADRRLNSRYPLSTARISVYIDGQSRYLMAGAWSTNYDGISLRLGQESTEIPLVDRLAILCVVISACDLWAELTDLYSTAVSRTLLESYNEMMSGLLATRGLSATGLAFSASQQAVAARFGDTWHLPNGQEVDLSAPEWQEATIVDEPRATVGEAVAS